MILLDTHAWLWWAAEPDRLSKDARRAIDDASEIGISAVCCWEVGLLHASGRVALDAPAEDWVARALVAEPRVRPLPLDPSVAVRSVGLGQAGFHGDPADRFLYATAVALRTPLVTADRRIRAFDPDRTVW